MKLKPDFSDVLKRNRVIDCVLEWLNDEMQSEPPDKPPDLIFLQFDEDNTPETFCLDKINDDDVVLSKGPRGWAMLSNLGISVFVAWYDMWVGAYIDRTNKTLYVCPLPCLVIKVRWSGGQQ